MTRGRLHGDAFHAGSSVQALVRVGFDGRDVSGTVQINRYRRVRYVKQDVDGSILIFTDYEHVCA
ncbi:PQQ-dependent sugar dehydrogenase [Jannaschia aquimarina]|uniref:Uncharacterized protein n=1 Tax=Jannaschia aquimarina TaxID=935700 RepID=A0A0D1DBK1_9RHOB|nr:PQQ-dependent sugar dehydrogenase [Jannaschia aquimarina]KIT17323.1 hypothetical protein jaqu_10550 [Jannaschia aquimarina]SNT20307.1 Glucose / Sorbosone dehydrogenase [Jannaschia aquimarina]